MKVLFDKGVIISSNGSPVGDTFVMEYLRAERRDRDQQQQWIERLKAVRVKAAHLDDGWVDRRHNTVTLAYPVFDSGVGIGDLVALGSFRDKTCRIVRLTTQRKSFSGLVYWGFEVVDSAWDNVNGKEIKKETKQDSSTLAKNTVGYTRGRVGGWLDHIRGHFRRSGSV